MEDNNQETGFCCCPIMMEETQEIKRFKPILIAGILIYIIVMFLDLFYLNNVNLFSYGLIITFLCLMTFNRCYIAFTYYAIFSIILLFQMIIPGFGIPLQSKFPTSKSIGSFIIYLFMFIFYFIYFYFGFQAYKEMKYVFTNNMSNRPQLGNQFSADFVQSNNNNYNNYGYQNNGNNYNSSSNNSSSSGGFKAFSGKGYQVGGS